MAQTEELKDQKDTATKDDFSKPAKSNIQPKSLQTSRLAIFCNDKKWRSLQIGPDIVCEKINEATTVEIPGVGLVAAERSSDEFECPTP